MNENLENQLAKVVEKSLRLAEQTGDFVIEQAPDLLREFYTWHITLSCFYMLLAFVLGLLIYRLSFLFGKKEPFEYVGSFREKIKSVEHYGKHFDPYSGMENGIVSFRVISVIIFLLVFVPNFIKLLKIIVAPKIYLIEYFLN